MSFEIAKAGWLYRQSSVLKRWKKNWFVLYQDATLRYFDSPDDPRAEEAFRMKPHCIEIQAGPQIQDVTRPPECVNGGPLKLVFSDNKSLLLCAETLDDMCAWHISLEQSRVIEASRQPVGGAPSPYPQQQQVVVSTQRHRRYPVQPVVYDCPGQTVVHSNLPTYVVNSPNGDTTTIIYTEQGPCYYRGYYGRDDRATGFLGGAALGAFMFMPLLWW